MKRGKKSKLSKPIKNVPTASKKSNSSIEALRMRMLEISREIDRHCFKRIHLSKEKAKELLKELHKLKKGKHGTEESQVLEKLTRQLEAIANSDDDTSSSDSGCEKKERTNCLVELRSTQSTPSEIDEININPISMEKQKSHCTTTKETGNIINLTQDTFTSSQAKSTGKQKTDMTGNSVDLLEESIKEMHINSTAKQSTEKSVTTNIMTRSHTQSVSVPYRLLAGHCIRSNHMNNQALKKGQSKSQLQNSGEIVKKAKRTYKSKTNKEKSDKILVTQNRSSIQRQVVNKIGDQSQEQVANKIDGKTQEQILNKIDCQSQGQVSNKIDGQSQEQILNKIDDQSQGQVLKMIESKSQGPILNLIDSHSQEQVLNKIDGQSQGQVFNKIDGQTQGQDLNMIDGKTQGQVLNKIDNQTQGQVLNMIEGKSQGPILNLIDGQSQGQTINMTDGQPHSGSLAIYEKEIQLLKAVRKKKSVQNSNQRSNRNNWVESIKYVRQVMPSEKSHDGNTTKDITGWVAQDFDV